MIDKRKLKEIFHCIQVHSSLKKTETTQPPYTNHKRTQSTKEANKQNKKP